MEKYELYYKEFLIGLIEINECSYYFKSYTDKLKDNSIYDLIYNFLKEDSFEINSFIRYKIEHMRKFNLDILQYQNSDYVFKKIL